jgi:hypothetical protein
MYTPDRPVWRPEDDAPTCDHGFRVYEVKGELECECRECFPQYNEDEPEEFDYEAALGAKCEAQERHLEAWRLKR